MLICASIILMRVEVVVFFKNIIPLLLGEGPHLSGLGLVCSRRYQAQSPRQASIIKGFPREGKGRAPSMQPEQHGVSLCQSE